MRSLRGRKFLQGIPGWGSPSERQELNEPELSGSKLLIWIGLSLNRFFLGTCKGFNSKFDIAVVSAIWLLFWRSSKFPFRLLKLKNAIHRDQRFVGRPKTVRPRPINFELSYFRLSDPWWQWIAFPVKWGPKLNITPRMWFTFAYIYNIFEFFWKIISGLPDL